MTLKPAIGLALLGAVLFGEACQKAAPGSEKAPSQDTLIPAPQPRPFQQLDEVIGLTEKWTGDLDGILQRRRLRALVPYSQSVYFIDGVERHGIAYEAMLHFEKALNEKLGNKMKGEYLHVVFIPMTRDKLLPALLAGYGDIIPANLMVTEQRKKQVDFSLATFTGAREVIVTGPASPPIPDFGALSGKTVHVRGSSSFFEHLQVLNDSLRRAGKAPIRVVKAEEHFEDEEMLEMVNAGMIPMTIVDENLAGLWEQVLDSIQVRRDLAIYQGGELAWAMRKNSPQLKAFTDDFIRANRKGTLLGNVIFNRYLNNTAYVANAFSKKDMERFQSTRNYFMKYAQQYQLDWLLLAAQGYQESRLNQQLKSKAGAVGVMQIKPSTAKSPPISIPNVYALEDNIHAGTKYLRYIIDEYFISRDIDSLNAGLFAVASYNAGPNKIMQLRKAAPAHGLDPNVWFDNVEILAARDIGRETVQYVSNIYKYYTSYRSLSLYREETGKLPGSNW